MLWVLNVGEGVEGGAAAWLVQGNPAEEANPVTALESWRPRRDLNPCYRRERAMS